MYGVHVRQSAPAGQNVDDCVYVQKTSTCNQMFMRHGRTIFLQLLGVQLELRGHDLLQLRRDACNLVFVRSACRQIIRPDTEGVCKKSGSS